MITATCLPRHVDIDSCDYRRFGPSSHYENTNSMNFGDNVGGITNPMVVTVNKFEVCLWVYFSGWPVNRWMGKWVSLLLVFVCLFV